MTEHVTQQIKEVARRFDGKKYIINEDQCAEHLNQVIKFEDMKKGRGTYESDKEKATHAFIFTSRLEKRKEETQET